MTRVLFVAPEYPPIVGGGATYVDNLTRSLVDIGHDIAVMTSGEQDSTAMGNNGISVYRRRSLKASLDETSLSAHFVDDLIEVIKEFAPDVIHAHHTMAVLACAAIKTFLPIRTVYTQHRTPEWPSSEIKTNGKTMLAEIAATTMRDTTVWVAPSLFFAKRLLAAGVASKNVRTIYPSCDKTIYRPIADDLLEQTVKQYGVSVGKFIFVPAVDRPRKDIDFVLAAFAGTEIDILISGLHDTSTRYAALRAKYPDTKIISHGPIPTSQMPELYNASLATIVSSTHEGFGLVAVEALLCGARVYLRRSPGLTEVASLDRQARTFDGVQELRDMVRASTRHDMATRLSQYDKTQQVFSRQKQALEHENVYTECMKHEYSSGGLCIYSDGQRCYMRLIVNKKGSYNIPKGHVEHGETWLDAAKREIEEETGVAPYGQGFFLSELSYSFTIEDTSITKTVRYFAFIQETDTVQSSLKLQATESIVRSEWVPFEEALGAIEYPSEREIIIKAMEIYDANK